jgi:hypothetical protein
MNTFESPCSESSLEESSLESSSTISSQSNFYQIDQADNILSFQAEQAKRVCSSQDSTAELLGDIHRKALVHPASLLMTVLVITGGASLYAQEAAAQTSPNIYYEGNTGVVQLDNNAFDIQTGAFTNTSNIPLPTLLPTSTRERVAQPTSSTLLAPNSVELTSDLNYINQSFNSILNQSSEGAEITTYQIQPESLELTTQFDLSRSEGAHIYGEGIEATVFSQDGSVINRESAFVRGDRVQIGPDGNTLPNTAQLTVVYGANDRVELRVLNVRQNNAQPSESGIYFSADGQFLVEDMPNGGDLDFNDGQYVQLSGGQGEAITLAEVREVSFDTVTIETPLAPELRQEEVVATDIVRTLQEAADQVIQEERDWGAVETSDSVATRLGHATRARSAADEQLVYSRYAGASQVRLGSDGLGLTGQLSPLANNPAAWPTLLSANLNFDPTVGDNEAGLTTTLGVTQFLNPTHQMAADLFGNAIATPEDSVLLEPAGLFNNRKWVGYVPPTPDETVLGEQILSTNGVFEVPADQAVAIAPTESQSVGRGNAAYSRNVGGLIIEETTGALKFVPQWTEAGYASEPTVLEANSARRVIYALVPQQPGQALQLGQEYAVTSSANGYQIADGGFKIISADLQPQNFEQEIAEVYAVEDTLPSGNMAIDSFNGVPGFYAETIGGERVPTVDLTIAEEVDARVGNELFPLNVIEGDDGQMGFAQTTRAAGFYLGAAVTGGIGNQQDIVRRTTATVETATDEMRMLRTVNTFLTPLVQRESVVLQNTETSVDRGMAFFNINAQGELSDVRFVGGDRTALSTASDEIGRTHEVIRGEEFLTDSETSESRSLLSRDVIERDQASMTASDSYANFSSVLGELALGGVLNFGNTPWTAAANTLRAELFARDTVLGRAGNGSETGWRTELVFHPFGEVQRPAHHYDAQGNVVALYQTEALTDDNGQQLMETLTGAGGESIVVPVNRFVLDEAGDRILQTVGTGRAEGPGLYVRVEDVLSDSEGILVAGGFKFDF